MRRLSALYHRAPLPLIHGDTEDRERWRKSCARTLSEHRQILAALSTGDAEKAKRILRVHLTHQPMLPVCQ
jgi:DNA-binding GntR family transcriptional regulator